MSAAAPPVHRCATRRIDEWWLARLDDADVAFGRSEVERIRRLATAAGLALAVLGAVIGRAWLAFAVPGGVVVAAAALVGLRRRADERAELALPEVIETVARHLRGGTGLVTAVSLAAASAPGRLGRDLRMVAAEVDAGGGFVGAIERFARPHSGRPGGSRTLVAAALCLGHTTGGATAQALDGVARTVRERHHLTFEARALSAQARLSAVVIGLAPLAFAALTTRIDPRGAHFLFSTPVGWVVLGAGLGLNALGAWWMLRLASVAP